MAQSQLKLVGFVPFVAGINKLALIAGLTFRSDIKTKFRRQINITTMGHKKVCFSCKKAFSLYGNTSDKINLTCPECGKQTSVLNHLFRPPKQDDIKKWRVAEFLKDNGFIYQHIYSVYTNSICSGQLQYPQTMDEAKEFVKKYKNQSYDISKQSADT